MVFHSLMRLPWTAEHPCLTLKLRRHQTPSLGTSLCTLSSLTLKIRAATSLGRMVQASASRSGSKHRTPVKHKSFTLAATMHKGYGCYYFTKLLHTLQGVWRISVLSTILSGMPSPFSKYADMHDFCDACIKGRGTGFYVYSIRGQEWTGQVWDDDCIWPTPFDKLVRRVRFCSPFFPP